MIRHVRKLLLQSLTKKLNQGLRLLADVSFRPGTVIAGRYRMLEKLGSGSYGVAYLCFDMQKGRRCVMKRISPLRGGAARAEQIYVRETGMMSRLHHQAIPELYEMFGFRRHHCFTMEFMEGSSFDRLLFQQNRQYTERQSLLIVGRLLEIVEYMHSMGIIHRDISIANVLVDEDDIKLIDLGLSREWKDGEVVEGEQEDLEDEDPTEKKLRRAVHVTSDFYAVGHFLLFLLYSSYSEKKSPRSEEEPGWEQELSIDPKTIKLLRRLLMTDQPFESVQQIRQEVALILRSLT
ncbi:serine/threonine protein kinase [Paenibacillus sp. NPDC056579]|uniref:serine/threonine protein kinase n=1 Tax=Paenibacillus sp. NPDC056579 TaxID=3345871 RepID=UPI0036BBC75C